MMYQVSAVVLFASVFIASCPSIGVWFSGDITVGDVPQQVDDRFRPHPEGVVVEDWVIGLQIPWSLVFLPDGDALVSERPGTIRLIRAGRLMEAPYAELDVLHSGEGGLMGLALHPAFPAEPFVYAMYTTGDDNRVARFRHERDNAVFDRMIISGIQSARNHNGGRIAFGPDDMLYVTTGDTWRAERAQDPEILAGKILRISPDGMIPPDNPDPASPVYSLGHRNPQGLAWHPETGDLFSSEHGPSGEFRLRGKDIVNVIYPGRNYGWPRVWGKVGDARFEDPIIMWEPATPPAGMSFWEGHLLLATLRSEALVRISIRHDHGEYHVTNIERWFSEDWSDGRFGRLRDAVVGPDGALYVLTSNRDGRGSPRPGDDRILRITR